jgi:hypothetical protein
MHIVTQTYFKALEMFISKPLGDLGPATYETAADEALLLLRNLLADARPPEVAANASSGSMASPPSSMLAVSVAASATWPLDFTASCLDARTTNGRERLILYINCGLAAEIA